MEKDIGIGHDILASTGNSVQAAKVSVMASASENGSGSERQQGQGSYYSRDFGQRKPVYKPRRTPIVPEEIPQELIPPNAVDITPTPGKSRKLWKVLVEPGDEKRTVLPRSGNLVKIHYQTWILGDSKKEILDSSQLAPDDDDDDTPAEFNIGRNEMIRAIDVGVRTMTRIGEQAIIIAHYDYAYGRRSASSHVSNIPNQSFVCIEITLVDCNDGTEEDVEVTREIIQVARIEEPDEVDTLSYVLSNNSVMIVKLEGYMLMENGEHQYFQPETVLPYTPYTNSWGVFSSGRTYPIPYSFGHRLQTLKKGDKILFTLRGNAAFEDDSEVNGMTVKAGEPVKFLVTIESVDELLDPFTMSLAEKVSTCQGILECGNQYMEQGHYESAMFKFCRVREYLQDAKSYLKKVPAELGKEADDLLHHALCQLTALYWKLPEIGESSALDYCNEAVAVFEMIDLAGNMHDIKYGYATDAFGQRVLLYMERNECELAQQDCAKVKQILRRNLEYMDTEMSEMMLLDTNGKESKLEREQKISANVEALLKEAREKEKEQKKNELKYMPPK